jgi:hypothetical protein
MKPAASDTLSQADSQTISAPSAGSGETADKPQPLDISQKTTGERAYDVLQFLTGKIFILAATAVLAFKADPVHGGDKILGMPNFLRSFQIKLNEIFKPIEQSGKAGEIISKAASSTMIISWGGNFFVPIIKWLENGRENISNFFNRRIGKPGEEQIAHERLKDVPKQNWMDVIKGRVMAWLTVFSALTAIDSIAGKDSAGRSNFAKYEDAFSRKIVCKLPGIGSEAKQIASLPLSEKVPMHLEKNGAYRFGKVAALDLFATSAAIVVWNVISRLSAKNRADSKKKSLEAPIMPVSQEIADRSQDIDTAPSNAKRYTMHYRSQRDMDGSYVNRLQQAATTGQSAAL